MQQQEYTKFKFEVSSGSSEIPNAFPSYGTHSTAAALQTQVPWGLEITLHC